MTNRLTVRRILALCAATWFLVQSMTARGIVDRQSYLVLVLPIVAKRKVCAGPSFWVWAAFFGLHWVDCGERGSLFPWHIQSQRLPNNWLCCLSREILGVEMRGCKILVRINLIHQLCPRLDGSDTRGQARNIHCTYLEGSSSLHMSRCKISNVILVLSSRLVAL